MLHFGTHGTLNELRQRELLVIRAKMDGGAVVCSCSLDERCLPATGGSSGVSFETALEQMRCAMEVSMSDLFVVLGAAVKTRNPRDGQRDLYRDNKCVVRKGETSWPFSAVRRTRGGSWVCL